MSFKEFVEWCNQRACDGCWSMGTAIYCIDVTARINKLPFWKREKEWRKIRDDIETQVVSVINDKIEALKGGN